MECLYQGEYTYPVVKEFSMKKNGVISDDENIIISRKAVRKGKINLPIKWWEKNVSLTLSNIKYTKNIEYFIDGNIMVTQYEFKDEKPTRHSENVQIKYLQQPLNSINAVNL